MIILQENFLLQSDTPEIQIFHSLYQTGLSILTTPSVCPFQFWPTVEKQLLRGDRMPTHTTFIRIKEHCNLQAETACHMISPQRLLQLHASEARSPRSEHPIFCTLLEIRAFTACTNNEFTVADASPNLTTTRLPGFPSQSCSSNHCKLAVE